MTARSIHALPHKRSFVDGQTFLPGLLGHLSGDDLKLVSFLMQLFIKKTWVCLKQMATMMDKSYHNANLPLLQQSFYGPLDFVPDYPSEPVLER